MTFLSSVDLEERVRVGMQACIVCHGFSKGGQVQLAPQVLRSVAYPYNSEASLHLAFPLTIQTRTP